MPPRAQQRPPQSLTPQSGSGSGSPIAQLNPTQLAALQEHIRNTRQQTGQEVTPAMITEWMMRNGIQAGLQGGAGQQGQGMPQQQQQQGQQQGQLPQQVQGNLDAILNHLYPPHLSGNPPAALAHLQSVLFPPNQVNKQSPFLQQVMLLAQNHRLSPEQMAMLKQAVTLKNGSQAQQQQQQQQYQQQGHPQAQQGHPQAQQQMQAAQMAQQQQQQQQVRQASQQGQQTGGAPGVPNEQNATQAVQQLRNRVHHIEALLARPDVNDDQRAKMQLELENARTNLTRVVKMLIAAQAQQQAQQGGGAGTANPAAAGGASGGGPVNLANLQEAQRQAMAQKAREIQAAQQANGGFRTASPAQFPGQGGLGAQGIRQSPSMAGQALPAVPGGASPQAKAASLQNQAAIAAAQAQQQAVAAAASGKKLTKKQQADINALSQQQAAQQAQAQSQALAQAQSMVQTQAVANQQRQVQGGSAPGSTAAGSSFAPIGSSGMAITSSLSMQAPIPEAFPAPRPTLSGGMANNPSISTPAITRPPTAGSDAFGGASGAGKIEALPNKDSRPDDSQGRTVSKRKIRELVESIDPEERLSDEVEDLLLEICDEFIDSVTRFGCQLARHRKSDRLEVKDLALHLERSYNIRVPGFMPEETRQSGARRVTLPPGHAARLAAIRESGRKR